MNTESSGNIQLTQFVQDDPTLTKSGMMKTFLDLGLNFSVSKILKTLKKLSITRKRIKNDCQKL